MRKTTAAVSVALVAASVSLVLAQTARPPQGTPPRDVQPVAPTGTSVIRGRVVAAESGRPVSLATISASAQELRESRSISTNSDGRYELRNLPAGRYTLSVSRSGYLTVRYGQRRPLEQGRIGRASCRERV